MSLPDNRQNYSEQEDWSNETRFILSLKWSSLAAVHRHALNEKGLSYSGLIVSCPIRLLHTEAAIEEIKPKETIRETTRSQWL